MARKGAKQIVLEYLQKHVGEAVPREELERLFPQHVSWERSTRTLRDDGYDLRVEKKGPNTTYCLVSAEPTFSPKDSRAINDKLRAMVLLRDQSTCQMCGKSVAKDGIRVHVDHIVPHEWGGETVIENLQCLCEQCNQGKKNWEKSEDPELMREISAATNTKDRLKLYFEHYPNTLIGVEKLAVIAKTREWTRQLRYVRSEYDMDIEYCPGTKVRIEGYVFHLPNRKGSMEDEPKE